MNPLKTSFISAAKSILPERVKNSIFHAAFNLARGEFDKFSYRYSFAPSMKMGLEAAASRGLAPRTIIDVGAYQGHWSELARSVWPKSNAIMIEPNAKIQPRVRDTASQLNAKLIESLLGAEDGTNVEFFVMESGSSVLSEASPLDRTVEKRELVTFDTAVGSFDGPALLKIDAQGYELEILKGATRLLPNIAAILLEVAIIEINKGAPLIDEVLVFMKRLGFVTYDILEIHRRPLDQALNQVDIIFVREDSSMVSDKRHFA
jgi:FkbM family methyltransferase